MIPDVRLSAESWRMTIAGIRTLFGRLAFLSSLRDPRSGQYCHGSLAGLAPEEADRTLRISHQQAFQQWISLGLAEQKADLDEYLSTEGAPRHSRPYRNLVPAAAREVERQLYLTDLETLLELLRLDPNERSSAGES